VSLRYTYESFAPADLYEICELFARLAGIEPATYCLEVADIATNLLVWLYHLTPDIAYAISVGITLYPYVLRRHFNTFTSYYLY